MTDADLHQSLSPQTRAIGARLRLMAAHPFLWALLAVWIGSVSVVAGGPWWLWLLVPLGLGGQMLVEYLIHRFIFHLPPPRAQWAFDLLYLCHYGHHDFPTNTKLFFVPWWFGTPMFAVGFLVNWAGASVLGLPDPRLVALAIVGIGHVTTFMGYEWYHMTAHLNVRKFSAERAVTERHRVHHFKDFSKTYHVSHGGQVIDRALGTALSAEEKEQLERSEFIRTLGMKPDDPRLVSARLRFGPKMGLTDQQIASAAR